jgi:hypothetical protein
MLSDMVLDFTTNYNTLSLESINYGVPTLKISQKTTNSQFEISLKDDVNTMISQVKNHLFNKNTLEILSDKCYFIDKYNYYYSLLKISNN